MPDPKSTRETSPAGNPDAAFDIDSPNESTGGPTRLQRGVEVISAQLKNLPSGPGVYRMLNDKGDPLYVGKARSLRKRVGTYTQIDRLANRLQRMVAETTTLEVIATHTEVEALLLESNLIKRLAPRYNVQLRDDKSFPYILIARDHAAPQILKHRGARDRRGRIFRPLRLRRRGQQHDHGAAARLPAALLFRCRLRQPHPPLPAVSDQALLGALRRPHRRRGVWTAGGRGRRFPLRPEPRGAGPPRQGDAGRQRRAGVRARGAAARPGARPGPHPVAPGRQCRRAGRGRHHRRAPGRRADLRPGLLLPRRQQLRQPRLFPQP